jgi:Fe2+ or Zn2+ uptake regulation protein
MSIDRRERKWAMSDSPITITEESVRKEGAEIEAQAMELAARQDRFLKLADYLRAIGKGAWIPATSVVSLRAQDFAPKKGITPADSGTWTSEVLRALVNYPEGATQQEVLEVLRQSSFAEKAASNPNGIYNATSNLEKAGKIRKHNGRLFLPHHYERFMELVGSGEVEDYKGNGAESIADVLVKFISEGDGLEAAEIVEKMRERGISPASVYNNLSKIVMKGRVRREAKIYLPVKNEALPEQSESASQITGSEGASSPPNMGSGND